MGRKRSRKGPQQSRQGPKQSRKGPQQSRKGPQQNRKGPQQSRTGRQYRLWYRHSGRPDINGIPHLPDYKTLTCEEITTAIGDHHITHMVVVNELPPFDVISPHLTHLKVENLAASSEFHKLASLTHLRELNISSHDFHKGVPEVICQLTSLESLYLWKCKLVDLPPQLTSLTHLRELYLSYNDLHKGIPEVIFQLTSLETLDLRKCNLVDLPPHLSNLNHLKTLDIGDNEFTDLPSVVFQLTSLQKLDLSFSRQLRRIDQRILGLTNLTKLDCVGCDSLRHPHVVSEQGSSAIKSSV